MSSDGRTDHLNPQLASRAPRRPAKSGVGLGHQQPVAGLWFRYVTVPSAPSWCVQFPAQPWEQPFTWSLNDLPLAARHAMSHRSTNEEFSIRHIQSSVVVFAEKTPH